MKKESKNLKIKNINYTLNFNVKIQKVLKLFKIEIENLQKKLTK